MRIRSTKPEFWRSPDTADLTDIETARKVAAQAGTELTEVFRLASPWIEDQ